MKNLLIALLAITSIAHAESITHGSTTINMDFVNIGYAGNTADTTGYGAVGYNYQIGKYEVTIDQFAKARAADIRISNGNEGYWNDGTRTVGTSAPASNVSAYEAMKFSNWLTTGDAFTGAYQFNGFGTLIAVDRDAAMATYGTVYVLPSADEWYKAAYYKPVNDGSYSDYANGIQDGWGADLIHGTTNGWNFRDAYGEYVNTSPNYTWETGFGGEEQNGTYDMMGNVEERTESAWDGNLDNMDYARITRGGSYFATEDRLRSSHGSARSNPSNESSLYGFRVAAIPEPSTVSLLGLSAVAGIMLKRRRTKTVPKIAPPSSDRFMEQW